MSVDFFDDAVNVGTDQMVQRLKKALCFHQARERLETSAADLVPGQSGVTISRVPGQHTVLGVWLDRCHLGERFTQACFAVAMQEITALTPDALAELVGKRLEAALRRFRAVSLCEADSGAELIQSIKSNPYFREQP